MQWSDALSGSGSGSGSGSNGPKIYVGAPSFEDAGAGAYGSLVGNTASTTENTDESESGSGTGNSEISTSTNLAGFKNIAQEVAALGLSNLGGFMLWDGPEGEANVGSGGVNVIGFVKEGLVGG